jgi:hypothetical protein
MGVRHAFADLSSIRWQGSAQCSCAPPNLRATQCVVAAVVDFGPGCSVDDDAGGPVVDASPNVCLHLFGTSSCGWSDHFSVVVSVETTGLPLGINDGAMNSVGGGGENSGGNTGGNTPSPLVACQYNNVPGVCSLYTDCPVRRVTGADLTAPA